MANTTTGSLGDSQQTIIDKARAVREFEGTFMRTTESHTLPEGTGLSWEEIAIAALTSQTITETTELNNPQSLSDSLITGRPTMRGINYLVTDEVYRRIPKMVTGKFGKLGQNAIQRGKDEDYLAIAATATTTLAGTGQTMQSGFISAAARRIKSNTTEPGQGSINAVFHGFGLHDIYNEISAPVGTYPLPNGLSQEVYQEGLIGVAIGGVKIWEDGNIAINATPDARGMIHSQEAVVHVQGFSPRAATVRREEVGGGADEMFHYDQYVFIERGGGQWLFGCLHNATAPAN